MYTEWILKALKCHLNFADIFVSMMQPESFLNEYEITKEL